MQAIVTQTKNYKFAWDYFQQWINVSHSLTVWVTDGTEVEDI